VDFVYSNAVVMHIQRGDRHREFLRNMVVISNRYVFLRENWRRHNFVRDLCGLLPELNVYLVRREDRSTGLLVDKRKLRAVRNNHVRFVSSFLRT
jgi:hypothetical protein